MSISQFLLILRARYKIILFVLFVTIATAVIVSMMLAKTYKSNTTVIVNYKGADPVTGLAMPAQLMPGYMATQADIISSKHVARKVIEDLGLVDSPSVQQSFQQATQGEGDIYDWLSNLLLKNLDVNPSKTSSVIDISFSGTNPQFAAAIANAFANAYIKTNIQLKVDPSKKAAEYFTGQITTLKADLEAAQKKLYDYQQEKGIISVDERLDVERSRLNELSTQLVMAQSQTMEALSRKRNATGEGALESPDVIANPLVQALKTDLARAESKFADISQKFSKNHPSYQGAQAEIEKIKADLARQISNASGSVATNSKILQQREGEIRAALEAQRAKVLELNRNRDALASFTREIENAQRAYDVATQRFTQNNMEGQSNQSDISVLNAAVPSRQPNSPKMLLNVLLSIILGSILGVGIALLTELLDRKVRSPEDLNFIPNVPVLGVLPKDALLRKKRIFGLLGRSSKKSNTLRLKSL